MSLTHFMMLSIILKNSLLFILSTSSLIKYSKKKIMVILSIELIMLSMMFMFAETLTFNSSNSTNFIVFSILMVTESVTGITIMISNMRESDKMNSNLSTWT